ncbi:hypothetical protein P7K49_036560 [Saguinus oedipus]|uniref:Uncharacterized protein n=1 Tax=Saguinus oedipus TaxID=9490 RepID=A0ABQ9TL05_SAGOE|nr:hypothetical protein P7K49_036560 [Saguinus oedipus]
MGLQAMDGVATPMNWGHPSRSHWDSWSHQSAGPEGGGCEVECLGPGQGRSAGSSAGTAREGRRNGPMDARDQAAPQLRSLPAPGRRVPPPRLSPRESDQGHTGPAHEAPPSPHRSGSRIPLRPPPPTRNSLVLAATRPALCSSGHPRTAPHPDPRGNCLPSWDLPKAQSGPNLQGRSNSPEIQPEVDEELEQGIGGSWGIGKEPSLCDRGLTVGSRAVLSTERVASPGHNSRSLLSRIQSLEHWGGRRLPTSESFSPSPRMLTLYGGPAARTFGLGPLLLPPPRCGLAASVPVALSWSPSGAKPIFKGNLLQAAFQGLS